MYRIWCERLLAQEYVKLLEGVAVALQPPEGAARNTLDTLVDSDAVVATARLRYNAELFEQTPRLRVIARPGIGYDNISIADATARGIAVCNTPNGPTVSTAEHAFTLILASVKQLKHFDRELRRGQETDFYHYANNPEIHTMRLGLVGLGRIAQCVAGYARAMGISVTAFDPYISPAAAAELGVELAQTLDQLLANADIVSLHLPLTAQTRHMINAERLAQMKPGAYLVNTARGGLIDEPALLQALESHHLAGAGLDVFDPEPPAPDSPLLDRDDVIVSPHIGGVTRTSKDLMIRGALEQILQVLRGERPQNLVNPEVWSALMARGSGSELIDTS